MAFVRAKRYAGGGKKDSSRSEAISSAVSDLLDGGSDWQWITFDSDGSKQVIEIAKEPDYALINIPHKEREGLLPKFDQAELDLPDGWIVSRDKSKGLLFSGYLRIQVPLSDRVGLTSFVEEVGLRVLGWDDSLTVTCSLQRGVP